MLPQGNLTQEQLLKKNIATSEGRASVNLAVSDHSNCSWKINNKRPPLQSRDYISTGKMNSEVDGRNTTGLYEHSRGAQQFNGKA